MNPVGKRSLCDAQDNGFYYTSRNSLSCESSPFDNELYSLLSLCHSLVGVSDFTITIS